MVQDALEIVKLRNNFYRDSYRKVVAALVVSLLAIIGLVLVIVYLVSNQPTPKYFASTDSGRIIPLIPLNQPNLSDGAVLQWASDAVISVYSYNFVNFRQAFQSNQKYFTDAGWRKFMKALEDSKTLEAVQEKKLVVSAVLSGAPIVSNKYILEGRYTWEIQIPFTVTFQSTTQSSQNFLAILKVQRVSTLDNIYGVGISEFVIQTRY